MEAHALRIRGWSISAIARHLDRDRKTVRAYLNGERRSNGILGHGKNKRPLEQLVKILDEYGIPTQAGDCGGQCGKTDSHQGRRHHAILWGSDPDLHR